MHMCVHLRSPLAASQCVCARATTPIKGNPSASRVTRRGSITQVQAQPSPLPGGGGAAPRRAEPSPCGSCPRGASRRHEARAPALLTLMHSETASESSRHAQYQPTTRHAVAGTTGRRRDLQATGRQTGLVSPVTRETRPTRTRPRRGLAPCVRTAPGPARAAGPSADAAGPR